MSPDHLREIPLFSGLSARQRSLVQSGCVVKTHPADRVILRQDEQSSELYVVLSGSVKVSLINSDGSEIILDNIAEKGFFGELSLFDKRPRSATVTTVTDCELLVLTREELMNAVGKDLSIIMNFLFVMADRLRRADERIETLAFLDVYGRVARVLLDLAAKEGKPSADGMVGVSRITHQQIAQIVGSSREAVTKAMHTLSERGLITIKGRSIFIRPKQFHLP